jgi:carboxyl-terminal processing protease
MSFSSVRRVLAPALLLSFLLSLLIVRPSPTLSQEEPLEGVQDTQPDASDNSDLSTLKIFNQVVLLVKDNYVDPRRIHPKEMMTAALDYVQRTVADVIIDNSALQANPEHGGPDSGHVRVTVGAASKDFDVSDVDTLWKLSFRLKDIFSFMQGHLSKTDKTKDIEYAAVAGMLSTLDPHSVFLTTESYHEMKLQTKGEFGGLGFVISMKDSNLTVVHVLPNTPAKRAGIKPKDRVIKIEERSTVNMDLNDAVSKLRGKPGSKVHITVARASWPQPRRLELTREEIPIQSVFSKLLETEMPRPDGAPGKSYVAGIKIKNFQSNTARDLSKAITDLRDEAKAKGGPLSGVVLDLRGNPGGLLEQAIQVTNVFVDKGTIVTTVGLSDKLREAKKAHAGPEVEKDIPLAVLVDSGSASASEIVSGALKNLNRAVIVGRPTFGKGSVQVLYDFADDTALKLTIAQYLTPGDISIQEVGIIPDIQLDPARIGKERKDPVQVFAPRKLIGEADLEHHFGNPAENGKAVAKREDVVEKEKPSEIVEYLREIPKQKPTDADAAEPAAEADDEDDADADADDADEFKVDFQDEFARDLVISAPVNTRTGMLAAALPFIQHEIQQQQGKIDQAIEALAVDWASGKAEGTPKAVVEFHPVKGEAGENLEMIVSVRNDGSGPYHQLRAFTDSENGYLDRREFLFGQVKPGETKSWPVSFKLPPDMMSRRDAVTLKFQEENGLAPPDQKTEIAMVQKDRPAFAFSYQAITPHGPIDGMAHVGQDLIVSLDVKNEGKGKAISSYAILKNLGDEKIFIKKGREKIGVLKPGETHNVTFELELHKGYGNEPLPLRVQIVDDKLDEFVTEKLVIPVAPATLKSQPLHAEARIEQGGPVLLTAAAANSPILASAHKGQTVAVTGRAGDFWIVPWGKDRVAFLPVADAKETHGHSPGTPVVEAMQHEPPRIEVAGLDPSDGGPVTDSDHFDIDATVADIRPLRDVYVFVNEQKVFFESTDQGNGQLHIQKSVPLKVGNNIVVIVAQEDDEYEGKRSFVVLRHSTEVAKNAEPAAAPAPNPQ